MATTIRRWMEGYGIRRSIVVNVVAGIVCAGSVAVILGADPLTVVAVVSGVVFLIA